MTNGLLIAWAFCGASNGRGFGAGTTAALPWIAPTSFLSFSVRGAVSAIPMHPILASDLLRGRGLAV